jgi:hypothetical protein
MLLAGCGNTMTNSASQVVLSGPPEGHGDRREQTTVGERPDVLGTARDLPVPASTENINGSSISVSGSLHRVSADWIVLDQRRRRA